MARFDIYDVIIASRRGYVLDIQADAVADLQTRVVAPLARIGTVPAVIRDLNPIFEIDDQRFMMLTQELVTVQKKHLRTVYMSVADCHAEIMRALDILLTGF